MVEEPPRLKVDCWKKSPFLVRAMFREAYTEMLESFQPRKVRFSKFLQIDINGIYRDSIPFQGINATNRLMSEGFQEALKWVGGDKILGEGK